MTQFPPLIMGNEFYCPLCNSHFYLSQHLKEVFRDDIQTLWLANMITHYRHHHIKWWDRCWGHNGGYYRKDWFDEYEHQKSKVNESSKRQIIRKATQFLLHHKINVVHFKMLQHTEEKTIQLAIKKLPVNNEIQLFQG